MVLDRVHQYMRYKNLNFNKFEKSIQVSHGSISTAWKHKKNVGSNVIEKILNTYPELSAEWLFRGHGNMLVGKTSHFENTKNNELYDDYVLVGHMLRFFNLKDRPALNEMFAVRLLDNQNITSGPTASFEQIILNTWEKKYGQELKSIKNQLSSFFKDKLERERNASNEANQSKAV